MLQLAFEMTGPVLSAAVLDGEDVFAYELSRSQKQHAETMFPLFQKVLDEAGKSLDDLDFLAVTNGPGSFTGIRMAVTAAKLLTWGRELPLVVASSLAVMADPYRDDPVATLPLIDARGTRVYSSLGTTVPEDKYEIAELAARVKDLGALRLVGTGAENFAAHAAEHHPGLRLEIADASPESLNAQALGHLARRKAMAGEFADPFLVRANYCSVSQAERLNPDVL